MGQKRQCALVRKNRESSKGGRPRQKTRKQSSSVSLLLLFAASGSRKVEAELELADLNKTLASKTVRLRPSLKNSAARRAWKVCMQ